VSIEETEAYLTDSLTVACWLTCQGFHSEVRPSPTSPNRADFRFDRSDGLDDAQAEFNSGRALINPATFDAVKQQLLARARQVCAAARRGGVR